MSKYDRDFYHKHKRIRDKQYADYGIEEGEVKKILEFCRNCDLKEKMKIKVICESVNDNLSSFIFDSITQSMSYEKLDGKYGIPCTKLDFYAYRRKAMAQINELRKG